MEECLETDYRRRFETGWVGNGRGGSNPSSSANYRNIHISMDILHKVNLHIFVEFQEYILPHYPNIKTLTQADIEACDPMIGQLAMAWESYKQGWFAGNTKIPEGHDEECYYCHDKCNSFAGNPSLWPVGLCHSDEPGRLKWHHTGCVSERLHKT